MSVPQVTQRPGLPVMTVDFYRWLLAKHIEPYLGDVPIAKLSTQVIREWQRRPGRNADPRELMAR
jgi:hypothetical protein